MSALPRPVAAPTREAQLATLRAWHSSAFGRAVEMTGGPQSCPNHEYRHEGCHVCEAFAGSADVIVAAGDSQLVAVDAATGEVRES